MNSYEKSLINNLVKEISNKNLEAIETLYKMMYRVLFCFVKNNCKNESLIEDIIHETFIVVIQKANKIFYRNCYSWILSIARNVTRNYLRKFNKNSLQFNENYMGSYYIEDDVEIGTLLLKLDDINRNIIYLKYYAELTNYEIAKILKISISKVKRKLKTSLNYLWGELNEQRSKRKN